MQGPECTDLTAASYFGCVLGIFATTMACLVLVLQLRVARDVWISENRSRFSKSERQSLTTLATGSVAELALCAWCAGQGGMFMRLWSEPAVPPSIRHAPQGYIYYVV